MSPKLDINTDFYVMQLANAVEPANMQKWIAEISTVINSMSGKAIVPTRIGRTEPVLRRSGALVVDEPLNEDMRRGAVARLKTMSAQYEVSAYIVHDVKSAKLAQTLRASWRAPIIFVCHEFIKETGIFSRISSKLNLNKIDHFIVPSIATSDHLMMQFQVEKQRISIVREGVDLASISDQSISQERTVSLAQSWGITERVDDIVLIPQEFANPVWQKNLMTLLDEWQKLDRSDVHFVVVGDDDGRSVISQMTSKILRECPKSSIQFVGHCADMEAAIKLSSMVAILSGEPKVSYPMALLAQAIGRFVVLPDDVSSEEFIQNTASGIIVKSESTTVAQSIASTMGQDESGRKSSNMAGRNFVNQNNSRGAMHAALKAVFENDTIG